MLETNIVWPGGEVLFSSGPGCLFSIRHPEAREQAAGISGSTVDQATCRAVTLRQGQT